MSLHPIVSTFDLATAPRLKRVFDNITETTELKQSLISAFRELDEILTHHSGPFASNCVIGSKRRQMNDVDEFTKDGIKIFLHLIVSENVSARFAARLSRFIGIAVDRRCHDGTTTSMLLFCRLAMLAIRHVDTSFRDKTRYRWSKQLESVLGQLLDHLETLKITEADILARAADFKITTSAPDVRASIAYHMAMISSKGDHDLSSKIAQVIRAAPKEIYGMFRNIDLAMETKERYVVKRQSYDLAMSANLGHADHYNYKLDTQYKSDDCVLFVTGNEINHHSPEGLFLTAFISEELNHRAVLKNDFGTEFGWEQYHENRRHLIIISKTLSDSKLIETINLFNITNPNFKISWFDVQVHPRMRKNLNKTVHYLAGVPVFGDVIEEDPTRSLIGVTGTRPQVHFIGNTLTLSNLYEKDGEVFHPLYRNPEAFPPYTAFAEETRELIEFAQAHITNQALDTNELNYLIELYRALISQEIYDIEVGGSIHEQRANQTVYEDAIGAALSAVDEGVVLGGYGHLAQYCFSGRFTEEGAPEDSMQTELFTGIGEALLGLLEDSMRATVAVDKRPRSQIDRLVANMVLTSKWDYIVVDPTMVEPARTNPIKHQTLNKANLKYFLQRKPGTPILLQAFAGYHEQLKRFRSMLPMLANTASLADMRLDAGADVS